MHSYTILNVCLFCIGILLIVEYINSIIFILLLFFLLFNCLVLLFFELEIFAVLLLFLEIHVFYILVCLLFTFSSIDDLETQYISTSKRITDIYFIIFFIIIVYLILIFIFDLDDNSINELCFYTDFMLVDCFEFEYADFIDEIFEFFFFFYSFSFFLLNFFILFCFILFGLMQTFFQTSLLMVDFFNIYTDMEFTDDTFLVQYNECSQLFEKKYIIASQGSCQATKINNILL